MAKLQPQHQVIANITNANSAALASTVLCDVASLVTVQAVVTAAGSPSAASLQSTIDPHEAINAGTANWVSEPTVNAASFILSATGPVTGVRLSVAANGGTWTMSVRQAYDSGIQN